jgi:hypothetical protein
MYQLQDMLLARECNQMIHMSLELDDVNSQWTIFSHCFFSITMSFLPVTLKIVAAPIITRRQRADA